MAKAKKKGGAKKAKAAGRKPAARGRAKAAPRKKTKAMKTKARPKAKPTSKAKATAKPKATTAPKKKAAAPARRSVHPPTLGDARLTTFNPAPKGQLTLPITFDTSAPIRPASVRVRSKGPSTPPMVKS